MGRALSFLPQLPMRSGLSVTKFKGPVVSQTLDIGPGTLDPLPAQVPVLRSFN